MAEISTTSISLVREHREKVRPPRGLWVPFPFGYAFGRPNDPELQHRVLRAALDLLEGRSAPCCGNFPDSQELTDQPATPTQASAITPPERVGIDAAMETTQMRRYHERWLADNGGRTALGLTGIPPTRFRGQAVDHDERPSGLLLQNFIRYCADD